MPTQVLMVSGYSQPSHHRKVELLADEPDFDIVQILQPGSGREPGVYPSANRARTYEVRELPVRQFGAPGDPHRVIHWPARFGLRKEWPELIVCEHEQESLLAAQVAFQRDLYCRHTPLVLYSWQNLLRRRSRPVRAVCAYTLRAAQYILCANSEAIDVLRLQGFRGGASVTPLFGIDTQIFRPRPAARQMREVWNAHGMVIGYVGRIVPEKGIETLIDAAATLDFPHTFVFVGSGEYLGQIKTRAQTAGIAGHCRFLPPLPNEQVAELLNAFDVLVLPSRTQPYWKEQFGRVLVEAMSCRLPVVGSNSGAIPEVVADAGIIFVEGSATSLAAALKRLAADEQLRSELGERGMQRVHALYSLEAVAHRTAQSWREALSSQGHALWERL